MKRAVLIHRINGDSTSDWIPWLGEELSKKGFEVISPDMPKLDSASIDEWVSIIYNLVGNPDIDTYIIGHGFGSLAALRYLSVLKEGSRIGAVFMVAPWTEVKKNCIEDMPDLREWEDDWIWWDRAKEHSRDFLIFYSDNDRCVTEKDSLEFGRRIGAEMILEKNRGHFTEDDDVTQLPALLERIVKISG
jgi:hypothetical protein